MHSSDWLLSHIVGQNEYSKVIGWGERDHCPAVVDLSTLLCTNELDRPHPHPLTRDYHFIEPSFTGLAGLEHCSH